MTFEELIIKVLETSKIALSAEEIWAFATEKGYDKEVASKGKTPSATIGALIYKLLKEVPNYPIVKVGYRPTKFCLSKYENLVDSTKIKANPKDKEKKTNNHIEKEENATIKFSNKKIMFLEKELHPYLNYYARLYMKCYCKTIRQSVSDKKEYGEWVHPDMVGCYFALNDLESDVFDLTKSLGNVRIKLFSFEIKRELNFHNLRSAFFQCVSNSSWANESYLVAAKFSEDDDFFDELKRLSNAFGIGIIRLNLFSPDESEIVYSAKYKSEVDLDMVNKLSRMNKDFKTFIERINKDLASKEIIDERYDKFMSVEELLASLRFEIND